MISDEFGSFDQLASGPPTIFLVFFGLIATTVVAIFAFTIVKGVAQWRSNQSAPLRSTEALVVSRRTDVTRRSHEGASTSSSTSYFVTFEEPSGERRELRVSGPDYGLFAEGDRGHLMHQGTRYKGFTRQEAVSDGR
ncbi:DUF2500 domain-containing protein [Terrabacter sp. NPDC000476]|uniref:DUF2500 domain-containing protein n=1 Tax=Terrabacter sp. NPDC000476 TaxID=3154258 RepID=UPI003328A79D